MSEEKGMEVGMIMAVGLGGVIGKDGGLPWPRLKGELKHFKETTVGGGRNAVIMGRRTWESLPESHRPLADRLNIIVSSGIADVPEGVMVASSLKQAIFMAHYRECEQAWLIGGVSVYREALEADYWTGWDGLGRVIRMELDRLVITQVHGYHEGDTHVVLEGLTHACLAGGRWGQVNREDREGYTIIWLERRDGLEPSVDQAVAGEG